SFNKQVLTLNYAINHVVKAHWSQDCEVRVFRDLVMAVDANCRVFSANSHSAQGCRDCEGRRCRALRHNDLLWHGRRIWGISSERHFNVVIRGMVQGYCALHRVAADHALDVQRYGSKLNSVFRTRG